MRSIDYFDRGALLYPSRTAIIDGEKRFSFEEVRELTRRIASAMRAKGLARQQAVALYSPNCADVLIVLLSIWRAEGVWTPVNTRNAVDANAAYLDYTHCKWLFYHSSLAADVTALKAKAPSLTHFVCIDRSNDGDPSLAEFVGDAKAEDWRDDFATANGNPDDIVGIFPTGGTTGPSKGVIVVNSGWGTMIETAQGAWDGRTDDPVCLTVAPITHAAGPVALASMSFGATQVILPAFDPENVLRTIEARKITHMFLPPTALYGLLDCPALGRYDTSSLRLFLLAGSPVAPERLKRAVEVFGPCMGQSYGQVECPMIATWLPPEVVAAAAAGDHPERLASCGRPTRSVKIGILDDDGNELGVGEVGEICARGALVSKEYFEKPEATEEIRRFNWHHTGDVGRRDEHGYIYIVDRKKDMVVTGGFNVFSAEVESAVMELAEVRECAVIGVPDQKWGEAVKAIVVLADGAALGEEDIIAHAKARLGGVKAPKSVDFVGAIPRTAVGKVDKKTLRAPYWAGAGRSVN